MRMLGRAIGIAAGLAAIAAGMPALAQETVLEPGWEHYGGDEGGTRYSPADDITPANVGDLEEAWVYRTGDLDTKADAVRRSAFEGTPILIDGRLIVCTPFNEVVALHPASGEQLWRYDPKIDLTITYANQYVCRGLVAWRDPLAPLSSECATRLFMGTNDRRLIALDAKTGKPCSAFGASGIVPIDPGMALLYPGEFQITSPPIVVRGVVIVGSSIGDNARAEAPSGVVRAFDAHSGAPLWTFDPIARSDNAPNAESWLGDSAKRSGHANVWAPMSGDEARGLVFLPTSSPSPDFYGGIRPGDNSYANSVVALDAETGAVAWSFQTVHHDIWDYDIPAQPTLARVAYQGSDVDAVIQATKQGLIFTLDRDTGTPVIPVEERPVPQEAALGEWVSATQPFPVAPAMLVPDRMTPDDAYGLTWLDASECRAKIEGARAEGLYTPPSEQGTLLYPFSGGGVNWGGLAFDPQRQIVIVNTSSALHKITLIRREDFAAAKRAQPQLEISAQAGTPFGMKRELLRSDTIGMPCNPPPWGMLHAIDMRTGSILWQVPFGTTADLVWFSDWVLPEGTPNFGGPIVTASGLVFIGAAMDNYLRAYDVQSGKELWRGRLPAGGQATPMTYVYEGKQYVVIAAGGHSRSTTTLGDSIVAFRLPN